MVNSLLRTGRDEPERQARGEEEEEEEWVNRVEDVFGVERVVWRVEAPGGLADLRFGSGG